MEGLSEENTGYLDAQEQPYQPPPQQYQPPPQQPGYGAPPPQPGYGPPPQPMGPPPEPEKTFKPLLAGIFLIIAGLDGIVLGLILAVVGAGVSDALGGLPGGGIFGDIILVCGIIFIIFGIITLLGGIMSATRKSFAMAILGSIFGIFCLGAATGFEATLLSIIALILIVLSKDEF